MDCKVYNRLQSVIADLVGVHQTCVMRGRTINTDTHVARSVLDRSSEDGSLVAMLQIDPENAFDRV